MRVSFSELNGIAKAAIGLIKNRFDLNSPKPIF
jgi:hypothetical protein